VVASSFTNKSLSRGNLSHAINITKKLQQEAEACEKEWASWFLPSDELPGLITIQTFFNLPVITGANGKRSTDCDGFTRIKYSTVSTSWKETLEFDFSNKDPTPTCKIHPQFCDQQWKSLVADEKSYYSSSLHMEEFDVTTVEARKRLKGKRFFPDHIFKYKGAQYALSTKSDFLGGCAMPLDYCFYAPDYYGGPDTVTANAAAPCHIHAENFALFYWPTSITTTCTNSSNSRASPSLDRTQTSRVIKVLALTMTLPKVSCRFLEHTIT
jgi:hypothetical protein